MGIILLLFQTSIFTDTYDMQLPLLSWLAELFVLLTISTVYSCYYSWARRQNFFCLQLHANEAKGSIQWEMTH